MESYSPGIESNTRATEVSTINKGYVGCVTRLFIFFLLLIPCRNYADSRAPAEEGGKPRIVYIRFAIINIGEIDYVKQTFEIDFYLKSTWKVDREELRNKPVLDGQVPGGGVILKKDDIAWLPENDFINSRSLEIKGGVDAGGTPVYTYLNGYISTDIRYHGVFFSPMVLHRFPFDRQSLAIKLEDFTKGDSQLVYVHGIPAAPKKQPQTFSRTYTIPRSDAFETETLFFSEFKVEPNVTVETSSHVYEFEEGKGFHQYKILLNIRRTSGYYFIKVIFTMSLIVLMSWVVFYMPPEDIGDRSGYSVTAFLSIVGHNFVASSVLPRIPYLTLMDYLTIGSSLLVFLTAIENTVVFIIAEKSRGEKEKERDAKYPDRALKIDIVSRFLFPISLVLLILWVLMR